MTALAVPKLTRSVARKVLSVVDKGLVKGVGDPIPGQMCVEAAVCFALGLPHGDDPACVGSAVRSFKIALNDADGWPSNKDRAQGLRRLAIAQLGSNEIDQQVFVKELALQTIKQIVPLALRAAASMKGNAVHKDALEAAALRCEKEGTRDAARAADSAADSAAYSAARAADSAADSAAYSAARAADSAAYSAAYSAARAAYSAAYSAARAADSAAYSAADSAASAADSAAIAADSAARHKVLLLMADIGVKALIKAKSPGCKWLDLCEEQP